MGRSKASKEKPTSWTYALRRKGSVYMFLFIVAELAAVLLHEFLVANGHELNRIGTFVATMVFFAIHIFVGMYINKHDYTVEDVRDLPVLILIYSLGVMAVVTLTSLNRTEIIYLSVIYNIILTSILVVAEKPDRKGTDLEGGIRGTRPETV